MDCRQVYRDHYRDWILELLDPAQSHLTDVVRPEALRTLAADLAKGQAQPKVLGAIAALELWCRS